MSIKKKAKEEFFIKKENDETNKLTDQSPAQVETNGPETKYGIVVNCLHLLMWKEPAAWSKEMGVLIEGAKVEILEKVDNFYKICVAGIVSYVVSEYIKEE